MKLLASIFLVLSTSFSGLVFAMQDEFYKEVSQRCFGNETEVSLKVQLAEYFANIKDYRDVANMSSIPSAIDDKTEIINFLESGLGTKRGKEPLIPNPVENGIILFATSGLDVMAERLVFLSQHPEWWQHAERFVALVSQHPHRKDLLDKGYLHALPGLFYADYSLESDGLKVSQVIEHHLSKDLSKFTHKDGMELILDILSIVDENISKIKNKWNFYSLESTQTDALINGFLISESSDASITFVCTPAGTNSVKQIMSKISTTRHIEFAISGDLELDTELSLHLTTPVMHINNLLFGLFNRVK